MIRLHLNQSRLRGGQRVPKATLARVERAVSRALGRAGRQEISVAFVSEPEMRRLNKTYRGKDKVTDVLSFGLDADEGEVGEIILSYAQARRQAAEMRHSVRDEVVFLLVHGILHVFGHDHERPKDAAKMFPLQAKILTGLGVDPRL